MKHLLAGILVWVIWGLCSCQSDGKVIIPSPIYVDNHYHGPADPEITLILNRRMDDFLYITSSF